MNFSNIFKRIKDNFLLVPGERFDKLTKDTSYKDSFIYLVVCLVLSIPFLFLVSVLNFQSVFADPTVPSSAPPTIINILFGLVLAIPLGYAWYAFSHGLFKLLGGPVKLLKTVQVMIYGSTSAIILSTIPILGGIFGLIALANVTRGIMRIHKLPLWKVLLVLVVLPVILISIAAVVMVMAAVGSVTTGLPL
jgi:hypothetical protein